MKLRIITVLSLASITGLYAIQDDCGLKDFFRELEDRVYCEAESSGSKNIGTLLKEKSQQFGEILQNCSASKENFPTEKVMQHIARGTTEMLEDFEKSEYCNGIDNIDKESGLTPLANAALAGNIDLVRTLLEKGANPTTELTGMIHGEEIQITPATAATMVPLMFAIGGPARFNTLSALITQSARYAHYPYDKEITEKLNPMTAPLAPFLTCCQLMVQAVEEQDAKIEQATQSSEEQPIDQAPQAPDQSLGA